MSHRSLMKLHEKTGRRNAVMLCAGFAVHHAPLFPGISVMLLPRNVAYFEPLASGCRADC